jgi:hypothetical protein
MTRGSVIELFDAVWGDCVDLSGCRGAQRKWHHAYESDGNENVANRVHDDDLDALSFDNSSEEGEYCGSCVMEY